MNVDGLGGETIELLIREGLINKISIRPFFGANPLSINSDPDGDLLLSLTISFIKVSCHV